MTPPDKDVPIEFGVDPRRAAAHAAGALLTAAGLVHVMLDEPRGIAFIALPMFVASAAVAAHHVRRFVRRTPVVVIDHRGVEDRASTLGLIPWAEIRGAGVTEAGGKGHLVLHVDHAETYTRRLSPPHRLLARLRRAEAGFEYLTVRFTHLTPGPEVAAQKIHARLRAAPRRTAGRCPQCGYDLQATPARCPECGAAAASSSSSVQH